MKLTKATRFLMETNLVNKELFVIVSKDFQKLIHKKIQYGCYLSKLLTLS